MPTAVPAEEPNCKPDSTATACEALATFLDQSPDRELEIDPSKAEKAVQQTVEQMDSPGGLLLRSTQNRVFTVNDTLASMVINGLMDMGVKNAHSFIIDWSNKHNG